MQPDDFPLPQPHAQLPRLAFDRPARTQGQGIMSTAVNDRQSKSHFYKCDIFRLIPTPTEGPTLFAKSRRRDNRPECPVSVGSIIKNILPFSSRGQSGTKFVLFATSIFKMRSGLLPKIPRSHRDFPGAAARQLRKVRCCLHRRPSIKIFSKSFSNAFYPKDPGRDRRHSTMRKDEPARVVP